jgi:hypothetical protein
MQVEQFEKTKVLVTVMTYPHPSKRYRELVCTAGITEQCEWVRLYPIDYRYRPPAQKFHKYQWIEIGLLPHGSGNDNRKESRKPDVDSIKLLGNPLSTENNWKARREIVDKMPVHTLDELKQLNKIDRTSLGIVKPKRILDLRIDEVVSEWKPEWQSLLGQLQLFMPQPKPLRKIPYRFGTYLNVKQGKYIKP